MRSLSFFLSLLLLVLFAASQSNASLDKASEDSPSCTVVVRPGEAIQAAVDSVPEGSVICLGDGIWEENVVISKSMTLQGSGSEKTAIRSSWGIRDLGGAVFEIVSDSEEPVSVRLEDLSIEESRGLCWDESKGICPIGMLVRGGAHATLSRCIVSGSKQCGIAVSDSCEVRLLDSVISANGSGIKLRDSSSAYLQDCTIQDNAGNGISVGNAAHVEGCNLSISENGRHAVDLADMSQAVLTDCTFTDNQGCGLIADQAARLEVVRCTLSGNAAGVCQSGLSLLTLTDSIISENRMGFRARGSASAEIVSCEISLSKGRGLAVEGRAQARVESCLVRESGSSGIEVEESAAAVVTNCEVLGNGQNGIDVDADATALIMRCLVADNNIDGIEARGLVEIAECDICGNEDGIEIYGYDSEVSISDCTVQKNKNRGVVAGDDGWARIAECSISENDGTGIWVDWAMVSIMDCAVENNGEYGIFSCPRGVISGGGNRVASNGVDLAGNLPRDLRYLPEMSLWNQQIQFPSDSFETMQAALNAIFPGGTLVLEPGEYFVNLTIDHKVSVVVAEGEATLRGFREDLPVLSLIGGADLSLRGVTIKGGSDGMLITASGRAVMTLCDISDNQDSGVQAWNEAHLECTDSTISGNGDVGMELFGTSSAVVAGGAVSNNRWVGIAVADSASLEIADCTVSGHKEDGIAAGGSSSAHVSNCNIASNQESAILGRDSAKLVVLNSRMSQNGFGMYVRDAAAVTVERCAISESSHDGAYVEDSSFIEIIGSRVTDSGRCGIRSSEEFAGQVSGCGNEISGSPEGALCPSYPGVPWPEGLLLPCPSWWIRLPG